jgi:membrane carboxypeptidase/penicillin-binding protein
MYESDSESEAPGRVRRGCGWLFFILMLVVGAAWGAALGAFVWIVDDAKSTITALEDFRPKIGSKVYSSDGELLGEFSTDFRQLVRLSEMPLSLPDGLYRARRRDVLRAPRRAARTQSSAAALKQLQGGVGGGSTITQQVVRNVDELNVGKDVTYTAQDPRGHRGAPGRAAVYEGRDP